MPSKATDDELSECMKLIAASHTDGDAKTTVMVGNLPSLETVRIPNLFTGMQQIAPAKGRSPRIVYSDNTSFRFLASHTVDTDLGKLIVVRMGLLHQK